MPIPGIIASSYPRAGTAFESIASATGTGSSGTITFSSIPSTYASLQIRGVARWNTNNDVLQIQFNGDTASNYTSHNLMGEGSTVIATGLANQSQIALTASGYTWDATFYGAPLIIDIHDYASTSRFKTIRTLFGHDQNTTPSRILLNSGLWRNTSAISSITISTQSGSNFNTATTFALYGIKGA